jgi:hypothetical protein
LSGCSELIINKCDVLERVGVFKLIHNKVIVEFGDLDEFKNYIIRELSCADISELHDIRFSSSPETI